MEETTKKIVGKSNSKTGPEAIAKIERTVKAIRMRKQGFTYPEIADALGWKTPQAAFNVVSAALDRAKLSDAREFKLLNLMRLESCVAKVLEKAERGNLLAVDRLIKISKRQGEILGFDEARSNDLNVGFELIIKDESAAT